MRETDGRIKGRLWTNKARSQEEEEDENRGIGGRKGRENRRNSYICV